MPACSNAEMWTNTSGPPSPKDIAAPQLGDRRRVGDLLARAQEAKRVLDDRAATCADRVDVGKAVGLKLRYDPLIDHRFRLPAQRDIPQRIS